MKSHISLPPSCLLVAEENKTDMTRMKKKGGVGLFIPPCEFEAVTTQRGFQNVDTNNTKCVCTQTHTEAVKKYMWRYTHIGKMKMKSVCMSVCRAAAAAALGGRSD